MGTARPRRLEYSESTRRALVDSAIALFTERGYAGTSLDEIARSARVTKGALYHHFAGKQALFEAAFEAVEADVVDRLAAVISDELSPWDNALAGLKAYLQICLEPAYQRIVGSEAPVVMGIQRWRESDERFSFGLVRGTMAALIDSGEIAALPVDALSRVLFGALSGGATTIVSSPHPKQTSVDVGECLERLLTGLRNQSAR